MNFNPLDLTAQPLNFGKGPSILEKWWYPKKRPILRGKKILCTPKKKSDVRKWICHVLFAKKMKKICQIWPRETLKHFTAAYRGLPSCTQSQQRDRVQQCTNVSLWSLRLHQPIFWKYSGISLSINNANQHLGQFAIGIEVARGKCVQKPIRLWQKPTRG